MTYETVTAEREGFEPPEVLPSTVFKTAAIDRSAISPLSGGKNTLFLDMDKRFQASVFKTNRQHENTIPHDPH